MWWTLLVACVVPEPVPAEAPVPPPVADLAETAVVWVGDASPVALTVGADALFMTTLDGEVLKVPRAGGEATVLARKGDRAGSIVLDGDGVAWMEVGSYANERGIRSYRIWRLGTGEPELIHDGDTHGDQLLAHHGSLVWTEQGSLDGEYQAERNARIWERDPFLGVSLVSDRRWQVEAAAPFGMWLWFAERWTSPTGADGHWLRRVPISGGGASKERDLVEPAAMASDETYVWWLDNGPGGAALWRQEGDLSWNPAEPAQVGQVPSAAGNALAVGAGQACWPGTSAPTSIFCWSEGAGVRERARVEDHVRDLVIAEGTVYVVVSGPALAGDFRTAADMRVEPPRGSILSFPLAP